MTLYTCRFFEKSAEKIQVSLQPDKNNAYLTRIVSRRILLIMKNVSDKSRRENQNTYVHSKSCRLWHKVEKTQKVLLRFHCNNGYANAPQCSVNVQDWKCNPSWPHHSGNLHTVRDLTFWGWHYDNGLLGCDTVLCGYRHQPLGEACCLCLQDTGLWLISGTYLTQSIKCQLEKVVEGMAMDSSYWQQSDCVTQQTASQQGAFELLVFVTLAAIVSCPLRGLKYPNCTAPWRASLWGTP
jgi:hypothetical protein